MGNFKLFMRSVINGNLNEVMNNFQSDFLERTTDDKNKSRPIHLACQNGRLEVVKFLVQMKCSIECEDKWKCRPIHLACQNGHLETVKFLCKRHCKLDCRNAFNETPVEMARELRRKDCENFLKNIIELPKKIFDCVKRNDVKAFSAVCGPDILTMEQQQTGFLVLEVALKSKATDIVNYLLNEPINAEEISTLGNYMKSCCRPDAVQLIQECLLYRSIRFHNADGFHLSCLAKIINGHGKLAKCSFLEVAAQFGCNPFIDKLLKKSIYNEEDWTKATDLAIINGHHEIAEAISNRKLLLRKRADKQFTWLHSAVCDNDPDMINYIIERDLVNPDSNNEVVGTGLSLAHIMCYDKCIEMLEKCNVDVNTQNKYSQSPLHEAIDSGMTDHCSYLISRVEDIDLPGFMGFTALHCAVIKGCEGLCDELMKNGADCVRYAEILKQSALGETVLPISKIENAVTLCMKIHETIYPCFLEALDSDNVNCCDGDGNSLLHMAVKNLQVDLCKTLINSGSNIKAINGRGNSSLFELFNNVDNHRDNIEEAIATLNILIESGVDINNISRSGMTVFQEASQWNSERLMISLLSKEPQVTCVAETDLKLAFTNQWFKYSSILIGLMTDGCLQSIMTYDTFSLAMSHANPTLLMSLFVRSPQTVQQSVIEDLLNHFALIDEYSSFVDLLNTEIASPKLFNNGETLLTDLLKKKNLKYCWAMINCRTNKKCIVLANKIKENPLKIAIETELFDLMISLIFNCDDELNLGFNWHDPLIPLFQKLSISNNNDSDEKLLDGIKAVICRGGDIYRETIGGSAIINSCTRSLLQEEIKIFESKTRDKNRGDKKICSVCLEMEVNCVLACGHTFCLDCAEQLYRCAICNSEFNQLTKIYFT